MSSFSIHDVFKLALVTKVEGLTDIRDFRFNDCIIITDLFF